MKNAAALAERSGTAHRLANYRMHQATHFLEETVMNFLELFL
jgi:hypothetical protein